MKILLLSDINSSHTQKWAKALAKSGLEIFIFSLSKPDNDWYTNSNIKVFNNNENVKKKSTLAKLGYFSSVRIVKKLIEDIKPDILHAHYATSYGMIGAISKFKPLVISVWGSDVFDFPLNSFIHKYYLKYCLNKASLILSTSNVMKEETIKYTTKSVNVIPFGIDTNEFKPINKVYYQDKINIGIIKSFEPIYGIKYLIKAFKKVCDNNPNKEIQLLLVGSGSQENEFKNMVKQLGIAEKTTFTGKVPYSEVPNYHNKIDIFVNVSLHESFGVSVIEASSCATPVIASNCGGLKEVVLNEETGLLIEPKNELAIINAIELLLDNNVREKMGKKGREFVQKHYDLKTNTNQLIDSYNSLLNK